jgi:hypothetical protein
MQRWTLALAAAAALMAPPPLLADSALTADAYAVHGIPGDDLGLDPGLPVDIAVDGACVLPNVLFGDVLGPLGLDPGGYEITISLADPSPCHGPVALVGRVDVSALESAVIVAYLGTNGNLLVGDFSTKVVPLGPDQALLTVYHTANAPAVDIRLKAPGAPDDAPLAAIRNLQNGQSSFPAELPAGDYEVLISPAAPPSQFLDPIARLDVTLDGGFAHAVFAVGSLENATFTVLALVIPTS